MQITVTPTKLPDVLIIEPGIFEDERGFFIESWHKAEFAKHGLKAEFIQDNHSKSEKNVLRGLHYQTMHAPLAKLVRCTVGEIFDVAVDLRFSSPTFGKWFGTTLSEGNKKEIFIPVGFAHGFAVISVVAEVQYKQTNFYTPEHEGTLLWNDQNIGIEWPVQNPILSEKDKKGGTFGEYKKNPVFK